MKNKILIGAVFFVFMLSTPLLAKPEPDIEVSPTEHDFGDVELGSTSTAISTITNLGYVPCVIYAVRLQAGGSSDFSITSAPPSGTILQYNESADVEIAFTPSALGYFSATLDVVWTNGGSGTEYVNLGGVGFEAGTSPEEQIASILAFFDASVAAGKLEGKGPGKSALVRLFVLRKTIEIAGKLIERGRIRAACIMLRNAYRRCDGIRRPPDFVEGGVEGDATPQLASMIQNLRNTLGCH